MLILWEFLLSSWMLFCPDSVLHQTSPTNQKWLWLKKHGISKWLALVSGSMDQNLFGLPLRSYFETTRKWTVFFFFFKKLCFHLPGQPILGLPFNLSHSHMMFGIFMRVHPQEPQPSPADTLRLFRHTCLQPSFAPAPSARRSQTRRHAEGSEKAV